MELVQAAKGEAQADSPRPEPVSTEPTSPVEAPATINVPAQFLTEIHGKVFVQYAGLLAMAHERGLVNLSAHFMSVTGHRGPFSDDFARQPPPDPAAFGMPSEDDGSRTDVMLAQNIIGTTHYEPDFAALRAAPTRIVIAAGEESEGEMANRGAVAVAERLGMKPVLFPSHHGGFLGGEFGWPGKPDEFAAKLRDVLSAPS